MSHFQSHRTQTIVPKCISSHLSLLVKTASCDPNNNTSHTISYIVDHCLDSLLLSSAQWSTWPTPNKYFHTLNNDGRAWGFKDVFLGNTLILLTACASSLVPCSAIPCLSQGTQLEKMMLRVNTGHYQQVWFLSTKDSIEMV